MSSPASNFSLHKLVWGTESNQMPVNSTQESARTQIGSLDRGEATAALTWLQNKGIDPDRRFDCKCAFVELCHRISQLIEQESVQKGFNEFGVWKQDLGEFHYMSIVFRPEILSRQVSQFTGRIGELSSGEKLHLRVSGELSKQEMIDVMQRISERAMSLERLEIAFLPPKNIDYKGIRPKLKELNGVKVDLSDSPLSANQRKAILK